MAKMPNLNDAYALSSDDDIRRLYATWAQSYDAGFHDAMGYQLPRAVAHAFNAAGGQGPVLDFGAGTGLVGDHLARLNIGPIDAVDLSVEMLDVARDKGRYRSLTTANVLQPGHGFAPASYSGIVSAGTFTHGHVGPTGLRPLLSLAAPGAVCVFSINAGFFDKAGFSAEFAMLEPDLAHLSMKDIRIYDDRADDKHWVDMARLVVLRTR